jgi:uncharacterized protein
MGGRFFLHGSRRTKGAMTNEDRMGAIEERDGACLLNLYATPRASRTKVVGMHDGRIKLQVAAPPVDGAANDAITAYLAGVLGVGRSSVTLVAGQTGKRKVARVEGVSAATAAQALGIAL